MHNHKTAVTLLENLDLGSAIAEQDTLLETARVETSAFSDLLGDKVDLVPGTKGSGKSALFRIFTNFLPTVLLKSKKVVIAHGVQAHGDNVFHAFRNEFETLSEDDFVDFWSIYFTSLAHEQFIKGELYAPLLRDAADEIQAFRKACVYARIPEIKAQKSLKDILAWTLMVLKAWRPKLKYSPPGDAGSFEVDLFGNPVQEQTPKTEGNPRYVVEIKNTLEAVLRKVDLSIWLMVDRLDEVFPRRTELEKRALRGLLRSTRMFGSDAIRVKVFLRDDMLAQVISADEGFTALTHLTARQADTLRWSEDQILTMLTKRLFANEALRNYLDIDKARLDASLEYRRQCFELVFPTTVHRGEKQSATLRWLYNHTMDGNGVVTPRDVIELVTRAKQAQQDVFRQSPEGVTPDLIGPAAIQYGLEELSKRRRDTFLRAEFPHLWPHIEKFQGGKAELSLSAIQKLLGRQWETITADLCAIGFLKKRERSGRASFWVPFLYRKGLNLTQGQL